jgi:hypothetical protein
MNRKTICKSSESLFIVMEVLQGAEKAQQRAFVGIFVKELLSRFKGFKRQTAIAQTSTSTSFQAQ